MTDYNKSTVAALRALLKDRGISSTGLTRKAQIIEKLEEWDAERAGSVEGAQAAPEPEADGSEDAQDEAASAAGESALHSGGMQRINVNEEENVASDQDGLDPANAPASPEPETPIQNQPAAILETTLGQAPGEKSMDIESTPTEETLPTVVGEQIAPAAEAEPTLGATESLPEPVTISRTELQVKTDDSEIETGTASPDPKEKPSVEKAELLPIPEGSVNTTAEVSRLNTEELEADTRKRKRRSHSPELPSQDIRAKKSRPSTDAAPVVHLKEDTDIVMKQRRPEPEAEGIAEDDKAEAINGANDAELKTEPSVESGSLVPELEGPRMERKEKAPQYKALFEPAALTTSTNLPDDDRPMVPALHPATPAIYIKNFMRPLRPEPLRTHLVSLATPPSSEPDPSILKTLFLDSMKTHALVLFTTTIAASRVRASLHGSIWPAEGNRKELWVDFVPEDSITSWIQTEEDAILAEKSARAAGAPILAKRFEVVYPDHGDGVRAVFQEVGAGGGSSAPLNAPRGPKSNIEHRRDAPLPQHLSSTANENVKKDLGQSFETLDSLFESTSSKPKLYFLPVEDARAELRLDELDKETSHDWRPEDRVRGRGRGRLDQKVKISFDTEDRLVEVGPDHGPWSEEGSGLRGGRGGRGGGGYRGDAYRGDAYRGSGYRGGRGWRG